ncbi:MAG: hypothetical protein LBQ66_03115, partial [Planctomycetaceae bacterium]|nr:hypothetical protein [Planctomycetaceae bacterium]
MLVRIFVFVFVLFFSSLLIARTPKDIEEFRETTNLAKDVWKVVLPRLKKEINTKDDSIVTHKTTQLVEQLRKCPQIGDGGVVAMILVLYDGYFSFRTSEIIVSVHNAITPSNCLAIMGYSGGTLWQNGYSGGGTWVDNYTSVILPVIGKFTHKASIGMDIRWARYPYPMRYDTYYNQYQYRTAGKLGDVGLYDLAWRVLIEEAWYGKFDFRFEESDWYFHVANNAYRSGDKKLGWSFLFCAAIFDNAKYLDKVMSTAQLWLDVEAGQKKLPEQKILTGEERKKTFLEIVECYRGMNAHPRAWQLINEHKSEFDNHETLIKKVQN